MPDPASRPSGLTALAVVNFVLAGLNLMGLLTGGLMLAVLAGGAKVENLERTPRLLTLMAASLGMDLVLAVLLILSAIGYLRQRPFLGRWLGTGYALVSLGWIPVELHFAKEMGQSFGMGTVLGMIYPLITLVQIHLTFRDLWRPVSAAVAGHPIEDGGMGITPSRARMMFLVFRQSLRQLTRTAAGLIFVLTTLVVGCMLAGTVVGGPRIVQELERQSREQARPDGTSAPKAGQATQTLEMMGGIIQRSAVAWMVGEIDWDQLRETVQKGSEAGSAADAPAQGHHLASLMVGGPLMATDFPWTTKLVNDRPGLLSLSWILLSRFFLPLLVALASFNLITGESRRHGLRFVLCRADRPSLFLGRFAAGVSLVLVTLAVLVFTITAYAVATLDHLAIATVLPYAGEAYLVLALTALPYVALCTWISALMDSGFLSLFIGEMVAAVGPLAVFMASLSWAPLKHLMWLLPAGGQLFLFHHRIGTVVLAGILMLAYTAAFLALGLRSFQRRDL